MASRLNLLFQNAPRQFLERTVLFTNGLTSAESLALTRHRLAHCIDIEPLQTRSRARVLPGLHCYTDAHLLSGFLPPDSTLLIPREDPPQPFVFLPEFGGCRLLVSRDGSDFLRLQLEQGLVGRMPPAEAQDNSKYCDSFGYWDYTTGHLVGVVRATAVLVKKPDEPWAILMQQIVGTAGFEVVRQVFTRALRY